MIKKRWMRALFVSLILFISFSFCNYTDNSYFLIQGKLPLKEKKKMTKQIELNWSKISLKIKEEMKLNFVLIIVKKDKIMNRLWKSRLNKVIRFLAKKYKISRNQISVSIRDNYFENTIEGIYVGPMLVHK
jgi:GTP-binding protein EngB required for normal cell division